MEVHAPLKWEGVTTVRSTCDFKPFLEQRQQLVQRNESWVVALRTTCLLSEDASGGADLFTTPQITLRFSSSIFQYLDNSEP